MHHSKIYISGLNGPQTEPREASEEVESLSDTRPCASLDRGHQTQPERIYLMQMITDGLEEKQTLGLVSTWRL